MRSRILHGYAWSSTYAAELGRLRRHRRDLRPGETGYGLFLPWFREEFGLGIALLGLIAGGLYLGYLLALSAVGLLAVGVVLA